MVNTLDVVMGPMFSGKTTYILKKIDQIEDSKSTDYILIKPKIDNRYEDSDSTKIDYITSHDKRRKECTSLENLIEIIEEVKSNLKSVSMTKIENFYIIIDEAQFFNDLIVFCEKCLEFNSKLNVKLLICGLDGDYERKPIGQILDAIPLSDSVLKLSGKCTYCEEKSIFTNRKIKNTEQIIIGGEESYEPTCRYHYRELNKLN